MAPISNFGVLAFASAALAVPHAQWQPWKNHGHHHHSSQAEPVGTGSGVPFPYPTGNATGIFGSTGTAAPTGISSEAPTVYPTGPEGSYGPSPVGPETGSAPAGYETNTNNVAAAAASSDCTDDVTITSTERVTVTVTAGDASSPVANFASSSVAAADASSVPPYPISSGAAAGSGSYPAGTGYATGSGSISVCTETSTLIYTNATYYSTYYVTHTLTSGTAPVSPGTGASPPLTSTIYATSTVTPSAAPSSSEAAPVSESSSSEAAPVQSSAPAAPTSYAAPSSSSEAAPVQSSAAPPASSSYAAPSSSAAPAPTGYSGGGGKRGLAYNDADLTKPFTESSHIGWGYNWGSDSSGLDQKWKYIPTLWGNREDFTGPWATNAQAAIDAGAEYLFGFNEPDEPSQSNLQPEDAATLWKQYMEPFAGKAKLVAPSVTNGQNGMGLDWLASFLDYCSDCTIDAVNQHWYDSTSNDCDYFKQQVSNATTVSGKPVFVSEFSFIGSDDDIESSLKEVLPWLDSNNDVLGYSYFMVDNQLADSDGLSAYGKVYNEYS